MKNALQKKVKRRKLKKIRRAILAHLDSNGWPWSWGFSLLLDEIDSKLFGMRSDLEDRD